jgi:hypothetical protein
VLEVIAMLLQLTDLMLKLAVILMILAIIGLKFIVSRTTATINERLSTPETESLPALSAEKKTVDAGILKLSSGPEKIMKLIGLQRDIDLPGLLSDIGRKTPKALQIKQLSYDGGLGLIMEGRSLSYEAVRLFEKMMIDSPHIESASLSETGQDEEHAGLIEFVLECSVADKEIQ